MQLFNLFLVGELSITAFFPPSDNFFGSIKFIKNLFNTKINKIIRITITLENVSEINYLIITFLIRGTNLKP